MQIISFKECHTEEFKYNYEDLIDCCTNFPTHAHNGWEFIFIKSGALSYSVDGKVFDIIPGSLIITRPGEIHTLTPKGSIHYERHDLIVAEQLLFDGNIAQIPSDLHVLDLSNHRNFSNLWDKFNYYITNLEGERQEMMVRLLINELWMDLYIAAQIPSQPIASQTNEVVTKAITYIKNHIYEPLTVQDICRTLFISPSCLYYSFTKHLNVTPKQYIIVQKLQLAHQALINGGNPTKVCREYGFHNYSTFYRNYQKIYGYQPSNMTQQQLLKIDLT